jgi:hypothetical protein
VLTVPSTLMIHVTPRIGMTPQIGMIILETGMTSQILLTGGLILFIWRRCGTQLGKKYHRPLWDTKKQTESQLNKLSLEDVLDNRLVKWQVKLPPLADSKMTVVPIPKYHPSPFMHPSRHMGKTRI